MSTESRPASGRAKRRRSCPVGKTVLGAPRSYPVRHTRASRLRGADRDSSRLADTSSNCHDTSDGSVPLAYQSLNTTDTLSDEALPTGYGHNIMHNSLQDMSTSRIKKTKFSFPDTFSFKAPSGSFVKWRLTRRRSVDLSYSQCVSSQLENLVNEESRHLVYLDDGRVEPEPTSCPGDSLTELNEISELDEYIKIGHSQSSL